MLIEYQVKEEKQVLILGKEKRNSSLTHDRLNKRKSQEKVPRIYVREGSLGLIKKFFSAEGVLLRGKGREEGESHPPAKEERLRSRVVRNRAGPPGERSCSRTS